MDEERLVKIIIDNTPNKIEGAEGYYDATPAKVNSMFSNILKTIQNIGAASKWVENLSYSGAHGYMQKGLYVPESKFEDTMKLIDVVKGQMNAKGVDFEVTTSSASKIAQNMPLENKDAIKKAEQIADFYGGEYDKEAGVVLIPVDTTDKDINSRRLGLLERANTARKFTEATNLEKESLSRVNEYAKQEGQKAAAKLEQQKARAYLDQLDKSRGGGEDPEDKVENKHQNFMAGLLKNPFVQMLTSFGIIIAILRRIALGLATNAMKSAEETRKEDRNLGVALGLTRRQLKDAAKFETAHGLDKGTIGAAVSEINEAFGDITEVDATSKVVQNMALLGVRGGNEDLIVELVKQGIEQKDPELLMSDVLNTAMRAYKARKNIVTGETYTGAKAGEQSMRSILTALEGSGFENMALMFEQWVQDQESSIFKNQDLSTYEKWRGTTPASKVKDSQLDVLNTLASLLRDIKARFDDIKDGVLAKIGITLTGLFEWFANSRFFMSDEEKVALNKKNRALNQQYIDEKMPVLNEARANLVKMYEQRTGTKLQFDKEGLPSNIDTMRLLADKELMSAYASYAALQEKVNDARKQVNKGEKQNVDWKPVSMSSEMLRYEAETKAEDMLKLGKKIVTSGADDLMGNTLDKVPDALLAEIFDEYLDTFKTISLPTQTALDPSNVIGYRRDDIADTTVNLKEAGKADFMRKYMRGADATQMDAVKTVTGSVLGEKMDIDLAGANAIALDWKAQGANRQMLNNLIASEIQKGHRIDRIEASQGESDRTLTLQLAITDASGKKQKVPFAYIEGTTVKGVHDISSTFELTDGIGGSYSVREGE